MANSKDNTAMKELIPVVQGSAGVTFFAWSPWLSDGWSVIMAVLGAAVLVLTLYNKLLEIKQRRRSIRDADK
ncbi:hypothetical protein DB2_28 [Octadecabacter Antarctic DB virus 2]|nr:hypothetical protein DB2_28 [Octadecabacter Antarctic DB virus 2]